MEDHSYVYSNYTLTDANPSYEITGDLSSIASFSDTIVKEISNANGKFVSISVPLAAEHCYITQLITVNTFYGQLASIIFVIVACAVITGIILAVLLVFLNVEKNIDKEQAEIKARREKGSAE